MSLSRKQRELLLKTHCGVINSDDAIDPKHYFFNKRKHHKKFRKVFQLCKQVSETLQFVLHESDARLENLSIVDVVPAPDSRRMLVILSIDSKAPLSASEVDELMDLLASHTPRLRAEISRSINRRKTPTLIFEISKLS